MLKLNNLSKVYRSVENNTTALSAVDIEIDQGEFVAIMGPSGCGKTTLLNILGLLDNPSGGEYHFMGQNVTRSSEKKLSQIRKHNIGFIFQNFNLVDELTVQENIELALLYQNMARRERKRRVSEVMDRVGIGHKSRHLPSQLSGGQQQRVAVARAVVGDQALILADEPTGNLDSAHGHEVMNMLQSLNKDGATIVMVTHSAAHADYARRTIHLFDGQVVAESMSAST